MVMPDPIIQTSRHLIGDPRRQGEHNIRPHWDCRGRQHRPSQVRAPHPLRVFIDKKSNAFAKAARQPTGGNGGAEYADRPSFSQCFGSGGNASQPA